MTTSAIVMATVNAPYSMVLDADEFATYLVDFAHAKMLPGHVSSFFGEVDPELQVAFAALFDIELDQLKKVAQEFSDYSGQSYPLAA